MIYSVNLDEMASRISYVNLCKYVSDLQWQKYNGKVKEGIAVYQKVIGDNFYQITIPCNKSFSDYSYAIRKTISILAITENKSEEQLILELLNPLSDILRVRHISPDVENGSILFEDAINLFENSKKLLLNATLDCCHHKKIYRGRPPENVQQFINSCRYGQTEIGSYVISLVCPFMSFDDGGVKQLTLFTPEQEASVSITRQATKKLIESVHEVKQTIEEGKDLSELIENPEKNISVSFLEALSNLNISAGNHALEINAKWAPTIHENRPSIEKIGISNDHYSPLKSIVDKYKKAEDAATKTFEGRISKLDAAPNIEERKTGKAILVYINSNATTSKITLQLSKEDYHQAVDAHSQGKTIRVKGEVSGNNMMVHTLEIL